MLLVHSLFRWVVVIVGIVTIVALALGLIRRSKFTSLDRTLTMLFSIAMDIQILLGLINLVLLGVTGTTGIVREDLEHAFVMLLALAAVHIPSRWRKAQDNVRFRNTLIAFVVSLVLVFIGVSLLPGGWARPLPHG